MKDTKRKITNFEFSPPVTAMLKKLKEETGLPMKQIVSRLIIVHGYKIIEEEKLFKKLMKEKH